MRQLYPHESALRKGRWSWPSHCYFVTTNAAGKRPIFSEPLAAHIIIDSLRWLQEQGRIQLMGFVVMPDHVHVTFVLCGNEIQSRPEGRSHNHPGSESGEDFIVEPPFRALSGLSGLMDSFKGYTGKKLNDLLGRHGEVWQPTYHDHLVRDRKDFETRLAYMHGNPVRKGLVEFEHQYSYSTANPEYSHLVDWAWLDGIGAGRARKSAPTV